MRKNLGTHGMVELRTGNMMPVIGLGTWMLLNNTADTVKEALHLGYRMIDTSGDYGTQPAIKEAIKNSGINRKNIYLITKVEETDEAYKAVENNLSELDLEYADLILIHRPPQNDAGQNLWRGLQRAKENGLAKDIGVSNYSIPLIDELITYTGVVPAVNQIEWSPFGYSEEILEYARSKRMIIQAYSPLTRTERFENETLTNLAKKHKKTPAQILIRWNLELGTVPIPKASKTEHLRENLDVFDFELGKGDMAELNAVNETYSSLGSLPYLDD